MKKLDQDFYLQENVVETAQALLGKVLVTHLENRWTSGRIVETEAYNGVKDKASHAYGGRRTARTEIMYATGGVSYVYLCYGIHHLFNVVTNRQNIPHAVLIRAIEPLEGIETMLLRRKKQSLDASLTRGPGSLSSAMGIVINHSGLTLTGNEIFIADDGFQPEYASPKASPRIGVDYAGEDALLPYRFFIQGNKFVSGKPMENK